MTDVGLSVVTLTAIVASPLLSTSFVLFGDAVLNFVGVFVLKLLVVLSFLFGLDVQRSFLVGLDVDGDEERNKPAARAANVVLSTTTLGGS